MSQITLYSSDLVERAVAYEQASFSDNTLRSYVSRWKLFRIWCNERNLPSFPAAVESICLYITEIAPNISLSTLDVTIAAIEWHHKQAGKEIIGPASRYKAIRKGIARVHKEKTIQNKAKPLTSVDLSILGRIQSQTLADYRDKALIGLAFFGAMRRSEVVAIDREHVEINAQGARITLLQTKTSSKPIVVTLGRAHSKEVCPILALEEWLDTSEITTGPIFRPVNKDGRIQGSRLTPQSVCLIIKDRFGKEYSGHSLRRGLITEEARRGISPYQIAKHSRHADFNVMIGYVDQEQAFETSSTKLLGV